MTKIWTLDRIMRFLIMVLGAVALLWVLNYLSGVLSPFFAAFLMAYILDPLVCKLQTKVKHRIVAVIIVLLVALLLITGALWIFIPMVVTKCGTWGN